MLVVGVEHQGHGGTNGAGQLRDYEAIRCCNYGAQGFARHEEQQLNAEAVSGQA